MRGVLAIGLMMFAVSSCQSAGDGPAAGPEQSVVSDAAASTIAGDITARFAEHVPPGSTTLEIKPDNSHFPVALTAALKAWGYKVIAAPDPSEQRAVKLDFALNVVDGELFAQLTLPSIALSRAYTASSAGASPSSPLSIMQRN